MLIDKHQSTSYIRLTNSKKKPTRGKLLQMPPKKERKEQFKGDEGIHLRSTIHSHEVRPANWSIAKKKAIDMIFEYLSKQVRPYSAAGTPPCLPS